MVWGTLQLAGVNVRLGAETAPSVRSLEATGMTTFAVGWLLSTTAKLAAPPASVVTRPAVGATWIPAVSLSRFVTATSTGSSPSYLGSRLLASPSTIVYATGPSAT